MASFIPNLVQKYVDAHAKPIPDYPQPLRVTFLNSRVWLGKTFGAYTSVANFTPAATIIGAYIAWPYIVQRYQAAKAEAAATE